MQANFACPHCQQALRVDEQFFGNQVQCPHCHGPFMALQPDPAPPASMPPRGPRGPRPGVPQGPRRPGRPMGRVAGTAALAESQAAAGERKAKMVLGFMLVGGLLILTGLLYFGSRFLQSTQQKQSTLDEVNAITAERDKVEEARRQKLQDELRAAARKDRDEEVGRMAKMLSATICRGDDKVAHELASELVGIEVDLDKVIEEGAPPKNIPDYVETRLVGCFTANDVLHQWMGQRPPQELAHQVAATLFGPPPDASPDEK